MTVTGWADPRGPVRIIVTAETDDEQWHLTLDCGHVMHGTRHRWFEAGANFRCLYCKKAGI